MRSTLGPGQTRSNVLWAVNVRSRNEVMGYRTFRGTLCTILFSSPGQAEAWILAQNLEQHFVSPPLSPRMLVKFLVWAKEGGFEEVALNPPNVATEPTMTAPIDKLLMQARAKAGHNKI